MSEAPADASAPLAPDSEAETGFTVRLWEILAVAAASIGFAVAVASLTGLAMGGADPERAKALSKSEIFALTVLGLATLGMFASTYLIVLRRRRMGWRALGFQPIRYRVAFMAFLLGLLAVPLMAVTGAAVQRIMGQPFSSPQMKFLAPDGFSWTIVVGMVLIGGLLAPLAEEIIFRGLIYRWLRRFWRVLPATVVSAAVFGLVHGLPPVIAAAFVVGLLLAVVYERTGSLWAPAIVHATQNCVAMAIMFASLP